MEFHNLFLITGRGWVADVALAEKEDFKIGDKIDIGNIVWEVRGVECQQKGEGIDRTHVGLILRPVETKSERIKWVQHVDELVDICNTFIEYINTHK